MNDSPRPGRPRRRRSATLPVIAAIAASLALAGLTMMPAGASAQVDGSAGVGVTIPILDPGLGEEAALPATFGEITLIADERLVISLSDTPSIRFQPLGAGRWTPGLIVDLQPGRNTDRDADLDGLGDIPPSLGVGPYLAFQDGPWLIYGQARRDVTAGHGGWSGRAGVDVQTGLFSRWIAGLDVSLTLADGNHMQAYYGVDDDQAADTDYDTYRPSAGLETVRLRQTTGYIVNRRLVLLARPSVERLVGQAARAPFIDTPWRVGVSLGAALRF